MGNFTDLTKEELIEKYIEMNDPEVIGFKGLIQTFNLDLEDEGKAFAVKLIDEKYIRSPLTWDYFNESSYDLLEWQEITREEYLAALREHFEEYSLNKMRLWYQHEKMLNKTLNQIKILRKKNARLASMNKRLVDIAKETVELLEEV